MHLTNQTLCLQTDCELQYELLSFELHKRSLNFETKQSFTTLQLKSSRIWSSHRVNYKIRNCFSC